MFKYDRRGRMIGGRGCCQATLVIHHDLGFSMGGVLKLIMLLLRKGMDKFNENKLFQFENMQGLRFSMLVWLLPSVY
jgi:hypothetical protein